MVNDLKSKVKFGMFWSTIERLSVQLIKFLIGVILARLLSPEDFGLIGLLTIFIAISQTFIDCGLGSALIQKKDRTAKDYSTVFIFNALMSVVICVFLYFLAPFISDYFNNSQLTILTRVLSLTIFINALALVQRTRLTVKLDFKTIAKINFISILIGGGTAIYSAYIGFGVWALIILQLTNSIVGVTLIWILSKWKFSLLFNKKSFKELIGFGYKLFLAGLYAQIINSIYNIVIGKRFTFSELGYYSKAEGFTSLTSGTITGIINQVTFPLLASVNHDKKQMLSIYQKVIQLTSFFVFPSMTLLALLAEPVISLVLGEKWMNVAPLLQLMVFTRILYPISSINMNILKAIGRSDLFLKLDLAKLPFFTLTLIISIPLGIKAMSISQIVFSFIAFTMNAHLPGKYLKYRTIDQVKDVFPTILTTFLMSLFVFYSISNIENAILKIIIGACVSIVSFLLISYFIKNKSLLFLMKELKNDI